VLQAAISVIAAQIARQGSARTVPPVDRDMKQLSHSQFVPM
jgi:hypothetical protein